jgi:copper chaperone CopZ
VSLTAKRAMETQTLDIPVIWPNYYEDCEFCLDRIRTALLSLDGMQSVVVNTDRKTLELSYDKDVLTFEEIREHARVVGVTVTEKFKHEAIGIVGLDCPDCAMKLETGVRRIPVVDRERVVGIVSRADLMSALGRVLAEAPKPGRGDESIRRRIVEAMKRESWCPSRSVQVDVKEGVVEFRGTIFDARERRALRVLAENVDGVKRVEDRLICVEPMTGTIIG